MTIHDSFTPLKAIKAKCKDCSAYDMSELKACSCLDCPLWMFRLGIRPDSENAKKNPLFNRANFEGKASLKAKDILKGRGAAK
jgi:hypothetical protein